MKKLASLLTDYRLTDLCPPMHSFVESMNSKTPTARLVKIIRRNEMARVSNVIKQRRIHKVSTRNFELSARYLNIPMKTSK